MPSWFAKVFKDSKPRPPEPRPSLDELMGGIDTSEDDAPPSPARPPFKPRRIVNAPILTESDDDSSAWSADIRIKARVEKDNRTCVFLVDRPVLEGHSAWFPTRNSAVGSPLAESIFAIEGVDSVLIHGFTVTVTREPILHGDWKPLAQEIGGVIRAHLIDGKPVVTDAFLAGLPSEDAIRDCLQRVIDTEINPSIAAHSGAIALDRVEGNTVYIQMMGGCQGCAASDVTLRQGIHEAFRAAVPQIGAILDNTDHSAGKNPFYRELPA